MTLITKLTKQYLVVELNGNTQTILTKESTDFFNGLLQIGLAHILIISLLVIIAVFFMKLIKRINASYRKTNNENDAEKTKDCDN